MGADLNNMHDPTKDAGHSYRTDWRRFTKLESMDRPGLTEVEFFGLFVKCDICALITTHEVFTYHHCSPHAVDDLELTDQE